ncbi:hypothetical protein V0U79_06190 [Hyphobacterium sp. HN65]|uniref:Tetratricopeptide repeat protein n=1 Tax=Hyphobacterium lacteum TaxID=3116575 RepID=A0ABU7LPV4_9PROT|nr:hypothetical protein [Hyphobacterium sp. HN65]MEE2525949.1 hypothetical protein [Hyphobacterium sp. HN65]
MNSILSELRRRNVFRVAVAYLVVGWLILQVIAVIAEPLGLPGWTDTLVIVLLGIAFPIALILAWAFEVTPEGVKLTAAVPEGESISGKTGQRLDYAIGAGIVLLIAAIMWQQLAPSGPAETAADRPTANEANGLLSVAVLPFVDMSAEGDQAYFADGISEEILNVLVRIPDLQVAGRTSSFAFRGQDQDLRVIGEALDVSHVLEGSVRRSGTRLRITAQLIRSEDGFHLWSETYDRELADIFDIQDEIASAVSEQLAVSLGLEADSLRVNRTDNIAAYDAYLQARQLYFDRGQENLDRARMLLTETLARDPDYAPAWTALSSVLGVWNAYFTLSPQQISELDRAGRAVAERAIELDASQGEAWARLGTFQAEAFNHIDAMASFERALELSPNDPAVLDIVAQYFADWGYAERARDLSEHAVDIDPMVAIYRNTLGWAYSYLPDVDPEADLEQFLAAMELSPTLIFPINNAFYQYAQEGRQAEAAALLAEAAQSLDPDRPWLRQRLLLVEAWAQGPLAIRAILPELEGFAKAEAGLILNDTEVMLEGMQETWEDPNRLDLNTFYIIDSDVLSDPIWREQVRRDGLLELWQAHGFPTQCRAVGEDDFECRFEAAE